VGERGERHPGQHTPPRQRQPQYGERADQQHRRHGVVPDQVPEHRPQRREAGARLARGLMIGLDHVVPDLVRDQEDHQRDDEDDCPQWGRRID
jgi:hypothetical protein